MPPPLPGSLSQGFCPGAGLGPWTHPLLLGHLGSWSVWLDGESRDPICHLSDISAAVWGGVPLTRWIIWGSIEGLCGGPSMGHRNAGVGRTLSVEWESSPALGVADSPRICASVSISQVGGDSGLPQKCSKGRERMSGGWGASHQAVATHGSPAASACRGLKQDLGSRTRD